MYFPAPCLTVLYGFRRLMLPNCCQVVGSQYSTLMWCWIIGLFGMMWPVCGVSSPGRDLERIASTHRCGWSFVERDRQLSMVAGNLMAYIDFASDLRRMGVAPDAGH